MEHPEIYKKATKLDFGKHKDKTIGYVLQYYPEYLKWAIKNVSWFKLSDKVKKEMEDALTLQFERHYDNVDATNSRDFDNAFLMGY